MKDVDSGQDAVAPDCLGAISLRRPRYGRPLGGNRTLVPTATLAGFKVLQTRPRFFSDSPLPYCTAVSK